MSLEEAKKAWEKNWELVSPVLDYNDVVSVVHWAEHVDLVEGKSFDGLEFPLSLCPKENEISLESTLQHLTNSREWLNKVLIKHGAVLFRSFTIKSPSDFDAFVKATGFEDFDYFGSGGGALRNHIVGNVYTANESPPEKIIPFHHEQAYLPNHCNRIFFYCSQPAQSGGETPICLSHLVYKRCVEEIPDFMNELAEKGVRYLRYYPEDDDLSSPAGKGWKSVFSTSDKAEAEKKCIDRGSTVEWVQINSISYMKSILPPVPAIRVDKRSGKKVLFNTIVVFFIIYTQGNLYGLIEPLLFGDFTPIPHEMIWKIYSIMNEVKVEFSWKAGDILAIDNKLVMHGRNFFVPPRRVYAYLTH